MGTSKARSALWTLVVGVVASAIVGAGCGGGNPSSETQPDSSQASQPYPPGPTREFIIPGGDNVVQLFGREGSPAERSEASRVIHGWMRARADSDWAKDCSYMARWYVEELVKDAGGVTKGKVTTCAEALEFFGSAASGDGVNTLSGPIDSLRVKDGQGYAQYHGRDGSDWVVPMAKDNGRWRVATAAPINRKR